MKDRKRLIGRKRKDRKKQIKLKKNFFPSLVVTIILWLGVAYIFFFVNPLSRGAVELFLAILSLALIFGFSIVLPTPDEG